MEFVELKEIFDERLTKFRNNQILFNKISRKFLATAVPFTSGKQPYYSCKKFKCKSFDKNNVMIFKCIKDLGIYFGGFKNKHLRYGCKKLEKMQNLNLKSFGYVSVNISFLPICFTKGSFTWAISWSAVALKCDFENQNRGGPR